MPRHPWSTKQHAKFAMTMSIKRAAKNSHTIEVSDEVGKEIQRLAYIFDVSENEILHMVMAASLRREKRRVSTELS